MFLNRKPLFSEPASNNGLTAMDSVHAELNQIYSSSLWAPLTLPAKSGLVTMHAVRKGTAVSVGWYSFVWPDLVLAQTFLKLFRSTNVCQDKFKCRLTCSFSPPWPSSILHYGSDPCRRCMHHSAYHFSTYNINANSRRPSFQYPVFTSQKRNNYTTCFAVVKSLFWV